jgi:hypothetical protein
MDNPSTKADFISASWRCINIRLGDASTSQR